MALRGKQIRETDDLIGDLVALIDTTVEIKTVVDNGGSWTLTTCNTKYLRPCSKFTYDAVEYTVIDTPGFEFDPNVSFTVTGASSPAVGTITLDPMKYYRGTVFLTTILLDKERLDTNKFPMVYLLEVLRDNFNNNIEDRINRVSGLRLFFLINTDEDNWLTDDHKRQAIKPMRNMLYEFMNVLNENESIGDIDDFTAIDRDRFGVFSDQKGHTERIFNDKTSGVELIIDVPIIESQLCLVCN